MLTQAQAAEVAPRTLTRKKLPVKSCVVIVQREMAASEGQGSGNQQGPPPGWTVEERPRSNEKYKGKVDSVMCYIHFCLFHPISQM